MIGVYAMKSRGWVPLHLKSASVGKSTEPRVGRRRDLKRLC
jgi:hypothetical protein